MTTKWLTCRNWDYWQTYRRDRNAPPWIKVHRRVLQDMEWSMLTDSEKGQLVSMWVLAADRNGAIPNDARALQRLLGLDDPPNLNKFMDLGFLTPSGRHDDASVAPDRRQGDAPEAEAEAEVDTEEQSSAPGKTGNGKARDQRFDEFWKLYPRHRNKKKAREIWMRKHLDDKADTILADLRTRPYQDRQWRDGFIPLSTTYLNGERWEDEMEPMTGKPNGTGARPPDPDNPMRPDANGQIGYNPDGSRNLNYRGGKYWSQQNEQ